MKRRFIKRWTLVETVGKKPTILQQTYNWKQAAIWGAIAHPERNWTVETETVMVLSVNGALPTHL